MNDNTYCKHINALEATLKAAKAETVVLLAYAIEARQTSAGELRRMFRHDANKLDKIRDALNKATTNIERID